MTEDISRLKAELIAGWDFPTEERNWNAGVEFETIRVQRRPRQGLAIGHSVSPVSGAPRLEMRVTAARGPNFDRAERLAAKARAQGIEVVLRVLGIPRAPLVMADKMPPAKIGGWCRRLHIGSSVAHEKGSAGTLGAFVRDRSGHLCIVSCAHVLAWAGRSRVRIDDEVHQPGPADQNPLVASNSIGRLKDFAPFVDAQTGNVDAAVARLSCEREPDGNILPGVGGVPKKLWHRPIGRPIELDLEHLGKEVVKVGRTTGYTTAVINALTIENLAVSVGGVKTYTFSSVYEVIRPDTNPFSRPGDSGALVLTAEGLHPVGLHFASLQGTDGKSTSYIVPWQRIHDTLGVELLGS